MKQFSTSVNQENDGAAVIVTRGPFKTVLLEFAMVVPSGWSCTMVNVDKP